MNAPQAPTAPRLAPGTVFAAPLHDGRWAAYVIVSDDGTSPAIVALDWLDDAPPTIEQARTTPLLTIDHHAWTGRLDYRHVTPAQPPRRWQLVGKVTPPDLGPCNAHAGWPDGFAQIVLQRRWETEIPAAMRAAYKACSRQPTLLEVGAGIEPREERRDTSKLRLGSPDAPLSSGAAVRWSALEPFAHLTDLTVYGDPPGLLEHVRTHPLIDQLTWLSHGRARIDLSSTRLTEVAIDVAAACELVLPDTVGELRLRGDLGALTIVQPLRGARMSLAVNNAAAFPRGLEGLRGLRLASVGSADLGAVAAAFPALELLGVFGPATRLEHVERLADLPRLRALELHGCYRLDAAKVPPASTWPELDRVDIDGHRKADAATLRQRLGGAPRFELRGGKADAWLAANLDNPFRDWIDRDTKAGKTAAAAWRKARAAVSPPPTKKAAEKLLRAFIATFNQLDATTGIDTVDREEIGDAFFGLADAAGVDAETAEGWFDGWRDF